MGKNRVNRRVLDRIGKFCIYSIFLCFGDHAQGKHGSLFGTVQDESGGLLYGVQLAITHIDTGFVRSSVTDNSGRYRFEVLPAGDYRLAASLAGFRRFEHTRIPIPVETERRLDITLEVGRLVEVVSIQSQVLQTESGTSTLGTLHRQRQIRELPLNGRDYRDLALLQAGVVSQPEGLETSRSNSILISQSFSVNGARVTSNSFLMDGAVNTDPQTNGFAGVLNIDSIQEFKILSSNFSAEFGRQAGSVINVVTKSGGNSFHGSLWEFFRHDRLDARSFFSSERSKLRQNQFGFALGGPIQTNRTFFFGSYEGFRLRRGIDQSAIVPTAAERSGDFSHLSRPVFDPATGQPFPENQIPEDRISVPSRRLLELVPLPNRIAPPRSLNFSAAPIRIEDGNQFFVRLDRYLSEDGALTARYFFADTDTTDPFQSNGPSGFPGFPQRNPRRTQNAAISHTHVFTPTVLNELRFAYQRVHTAFFYDSRISAKEIGISGLDTGPDIGIPDIRIPGFSGIGNSIQQPSRVADNTFQLSEMFSFSTGDHNFRAGMEIRREMENFFLRFIFNGNAFFTGFATGDALADFLLGRVNVFTFSDPSSRAEFYPRNWAFNYFLQDDWKVASGLTLNVGLRYEFNTPVAEKFSRASTIFVRTPPQEGVPQSGELDLVVAGEGGLGPGKTNFSDKNNFAPRLGLAYDVAGNGRVVLRSGFGVFYDQDSLNKTINQLLSPPFYRLGIFFDSPLEAPLTGINLPAAPFALPLDPFIRTPYMTHWNLNVQVQLRPDLLLDTAYAGSAGRKLAAFREMNQPINTPDASPLNKDERRPFRDFSSIGQITNQGRSQYHALQTTLDRRFSSEMGFRGAYTYSKSIDWPTSIFNAGAGSTIEQFVSQDDDNRRAEKALSSFDTRHRLVFNGIFELPLGKGRRWLPNLPPAVNLLASNWQVSPVVILQSGNPFTIRDLSDRCLTGGLVVTCRPDRAPDQSVVPAKRTPERYFNPAAFTQAAFGEFGNVGRNTLIGDGIAVVDLSVARKFSLPQLNEQAALEFRAEFFNLLNGAEFAAPVTDISSAAFGSVINTRMRPREIQFALKLNF